MSSLRNSVQRRNHKERSQPHERSKWGILEKRKDYKLRAGDYNVKKKKIKQLKRLAAERNPDEFYFGMVNGSTDAKGIHVASRGNKALDQDVVRLLKTQDASYLRVASAIERKKRERLEQELHFMPETQGSSGGGGGYNDDDDDDDSGVKAVMKDIGAVDINSGKISRKKHTVFVDNAEEVRNFDAAKHFDTHPELLGRTFNRPRLSQLEASGDKTGGSTAVTMATNIDRATNKKMARAREQKYKELEARMKREAELKVAEQELDEQRERMGKHGPRMGKTKSGKRFIVRERKR